MVNAATETIVFDMVPTVLDRQRPERDAATPRRVRAIGIAYRPQDARDTIPCNSETPIDVESRWPRLGLILIVDGREQLVALLSRDLEHVLNAIYSDSVFLNSVLHGAVSSDIRLVALRGSKSDVLEGFSLQRSTPPGLRERLSDNDGAPGRD